MRKPVTSYRLELTPACASARIDGIRNDVGFAVDITAGMGVPEFEAKAVRLADGSEVEGLQVSTGNPHFVIVTGDAEFSIAGKSWSAIGAEICVHRDFPSQTNVEFELHVAEPARDRDLASGKRGVGPTSSSGTGTSRDGYGGNRIGAGKFATDRCSARWAAVRSMERAGDGTAFDRAGGADRAR